MTAEKKKILLVAAVGLGAYFLFFNKPAAAAPGSDVLENYTGEEPPPPPVVVAAELYPLQTYAAIQDRAALVRYAMNNAKLIAAYNKMNEQELRTAYNYYFGYVTQYKKLYRTPGATGVYEDGGYDQALYDAVQALRTKYGIF